MPVFYFRKYIFEGGPFHKPYRLPNAPSPHLRFNFVCILNLNGKMKIKLNK